MSVEPRLLSRSSLCAYLGALPWSYVRDLIASGRLPRPLWEQLDTHKLARWDRPAVDRALDAASGRLCRLRQRRNFLIKPWASNDARAQST
jgi:hypothetical protein